MGISISVIVPAYNEEESLAVFIPALVAELKKIRSSYEVIVVNDGSADKTSDVVLKFHENNSAINLVSLSRNFGAQAALCAGYRLAHGDCVISMDADMQHPVATIAEMIDKWRQGYDVVYAIRRQSTHLGIFKRISAGLFYRFFKWLTGLKSDMGADFRLMSRSAVNALNQFSETPVFLRGLVSRLGFRQCSIYYDEKKRQYGGPSRYTLKKMLNLALTGIVGFSLKPLHLIFLIGFFMLLVGITSLCAILAYYFITYEITMMNVLLSVLISFSGVQVLILGIIGEYIGNIVMTVKKRPLYLIETNTLGKDK